MVDVLWDADAERAFSDVGLVYGKYVTRKIRKKGTREKRKLPT